MGAPRADPVACIVVPCYNEAERLDEPALLDLVADGMIRVLLVDDGSTDGTRTVFERLGAASDRIETMILDRNRGKAEAVRRGLVEALATPCAFVGYYDADLATPPAELLRLVETIRDRPDIECVLGARVAMLGSAIERRPVRHYAGRLFASAASAALGVQVYDTQCGAKVFRVGDALSAAVQQPFRSRWAFDVELLGRLFEGTQDVRGLSADAFLEVPLRAWRDVAGSSLGGAGVARALLGLLAVARGRVRRDRRTTR